MEKDEVVKIRKLLVLLIGLFVINAVYAANVGWVVKFPDNSIEKGCAQVNDDANGYELLQATGLTLLWSSYGTYGHGLCKINGVGDDVAGGGCAFSGNWWNFDILIDNAWQQMPVGYDTPGGCWDGNILSWGGHYCAQNGDVLGWAYSNGTGFPDVYTFDELCPSKLMITELKAYVDGEKVSGADETGGRIKDAKPESEIKLKLEVSNLYTDNEDIDIDDIAVTATIDDIDDGDELEEESDEFDLEADKEEDIEIIFNVPLKVEEDNYQMTIVLEGEDSDGWEHEQTLELEVEVDKEKHELRFFDVDLAPSTLKCDRATRLDLRITNLGTSDEDVDLEIENSALGIRITDTFELEEDPDDDDNDFESEYFISIDDDVAAGSYPIKITAEYGSKKESETVNLEIEDCATSGGEIKEGTLISQYQGLPPGYPSYTPEAIVQEGEPEPARFGGASLIIVLAEVMVIVIGVVAFLVLKP
ncbi:hypothetical protein KY360_01455 [Candidatus Woesearchaeota archaeon]|nr:hypothetical protein [Candidatus Woesearchaeota archaeon]